MRELKRDELYDILTGCTILGTGGGGPLEMGKRMIDMALDAGKTFRLVALDDVPDGDLIITPYYCGAVSPEDEDITKKYGHLKEMAGEPVVKAVQVMESYLGRRIDGVISTEIGGANTAAAFIAGAMLDKYIVDADPVGRAVPELQHSTYYLNGISITPMAIVNPFGESAIFTEVVDDFRAEAMVRSIAVASKNTVAVADHLTTGTSIKSSVIPGVISTALAMGKAHREAIENQANIGEAIAAAGNGRVAFKGTVGQFHWETVEGFTVGEVLIDGEGPYTGHNLRIWFKNEHIVSWLNGKPYINAPDMICLIDSNTGKPVTNPYYEVGKPLTAIALPAPKEWTTESGLDCFSAKYFGFDIEYVPYNSRIDAKGVIIPQ